MLPRASCQPRGNLEGEDIRSYRAPGILSAAEVEGRQEETGIVRSLLLLLLSTGQMTGLDCGMGAEMAMFTVAAAAVGVAAAAAAVAAGRSDYMARPQLWSKGWDG